MTIETSASAALRWIVLAIAALLTGAPARAAEHFMLWGGGPNPKNSQVSIESNVVWIQSILKARGFADGQTWFGSGNEDRDVIFNATNRDSSSRFEPMARLFGELDDNNRLFRSHQVPNVAGPSSLATIRPALTTQIGALRPGDGLLLVYSGHGSFDDNPEQNALRLWGETPLSVADLRQLMQGAASGSQIRFVLPQCFSGAFLRSVLDAPSGGLPPQSAAARCGFTSVSERHEAEGCTPGIDAVDYRDYSTYFFAALSGQTRTGASLSRNADADGNGTVSLLEAHGYAYTEAQSADVPRASSEFFLERTRNWLTRWLPATRLREDNPFLQLTRRLAERTGLDRVTGARAAIAVRTEAAELQRAEIAHHEIKTKEQELRNALSESYKLRWPEAQAPHSAGFAALLADQARLDAALDWIRAEPRYPELVALQDRIREEKLALLDKRRSVTQLVKLRRAFRLATFYEHIQATGSRSEREAFAALRSCETFELPQLAVK